jgi:Uma2 family endonuclease
MARPADKMATRFSYAQYLSFSDGARWELIDGEAQMMAPSPTEEHQSIAGELFAQLKSQLKGQTCRAYMAALDVRLASETDSDEQTFDVVQPDVFVVCDPKKIDRRGIRGAPDFVIEVVSPASQKMDQISKRDLYERHGVKEYWIVDPSGRVFTRYRLEKTGKFSPPHILECAGMQSVRCIRGLKIDFTQMEWRDWDAA